MVNISPFLESVPDMYDINGYFCEIGLVITDKNILMMPRKLFTLLLFSLSALITFAQDPLKADSSYRKPFVEDDPVVIMLDSLANLKVFQNSSYLNTPSSKVNPVYSDDQIPYFSDSVYRERIASMSIQSPFEYVYNPSVRQFIDLYAYRKRGLTSRILGLAQIYFPMFEEQLDKYNMPLELKYLAVIESALNPVANSRVGAKGLWQFMYGTGKVYGLKLSSYVDDRFDPIKSTIAACEHLTDLFDIYGNWSLALAAYNSGAGNVNKAIRRAGGAKDFWIIQRFLPKETRSYVPAFIAASYVMTYAAEHHITPTDPGILFYEIDTVTVKRPLTFDQLSEMLNIPMEEVQFLNPAYKQGVIPATSGNPFMLRLRKKYVGDFINNEEALYAYKTRKGMEQESLRALAMMYNRETTEYRCRKGETMAGVAKKFHMTVSELKSLNGLRKNTISSKQRLLVYSGPAKPRPEFTQTLNKTDQEKDTVVKSLVVVEEQDPDPVPVLHVVRKGETLNKIALKYGCSISDLSEWNHLKSQSLIIGQKLKINGQSDEIASRTSTKTPAEHKKQNGSSASKGTRQKYITYTIQSGDNLWDIAEKFDGATVSQIKKLNKLSNSQRLKVGQKIRIMPAN